MSDQQYPFKSWVLTPSFAPKEVELVAASHYSDYHHTAANKYYHQSELYASKRVAIEAGWRKLDEQQNTLKKRADAIAKKKATLTKHSSDL
ncbi:MULTISPECIES: hypothetical protein [unclassified Pseudomonas]|uniref:hypothetical protein n=1 Tax=unclassified Pseudomonas TaxID=196821 RepID=UPI000A1D5BE4|nr:MULTISPECIES: hypothetical protein [unclassified Pseudomonas]